MTTLSLPPGFVGQFASNNPPEGWLICDGRAVSRVKYAALFDAIGITYGYGDQETTFNLPDYRGRVLRMLDLFAGRDPDSASRSPMATGATGGANLGSIQDDETKSHTHTQAAHDHGFNMYSGGVGVNADRVTHPGTVNQFTAGNVVLDSVAPVISSTGGNETRMKNAYILFAIKC